MYKKELEMSKYLFYCSLAIRSKSKRLRKKANNIVDYQIEEYFPQY